MQPAYMSILHIAYLCLLLYHAFMLLLFMHINIFISFALFLISANVIDVWCQSFVRVSDQHES